MVTWLFALVLMQHTTALQKHVVEETAHLEARKIKKVEVSILMS